MSGGVFEFTCRPYQFTVRTPEMPASVVVGTLGISDERSVPVVASAASLLPSTNGTTLEISPNAASIVPPMMSATDWLVPRYGTWVTSIPASLCKSSIDRCVVVPMPAEPKVSLPGLAFA